MRLIASVLMLMASMFASIGAVVYPARTNGNNTFYGTNSHIGPVIVGTTNLISNQGSSINNAKFTNGVIRATQGIFSSSVSSSGSVLGDTVAATTSLDTPIIVFGATSEAAMINPAQRVVSFVDQSSNDKITVTLSNLTASGTILGKSSGLTNLSGYGLASTNENNMWVTNLTATTVAGNGESLTNGSGYHFADTNWVLSQLSALGAYVYITGVTNALTFTNSTESVARTNIWEGWTAPTTTVTTNTYSGLTLNAYIRHVVSTNTYTVVEAGPVSVSSYVYRAGGAGTVSGHYEFYVLDTVSNICYEIASSPAQTISATAPTLMQWSISVPTSFIATNAVKFVVAFKMDSVGTGGPTLSFVSGGNYDAHANFIRPLSSATINWSQVAGTANLPMPTNAPAANKMIYATSDSSAKWDDAPSGTGGGTGMLTNQFTTNAIGSPIDGSFWSKVNGAAGIPTNGMTLSNSVPASSGNQYPGPFYASIGNAWTGGNSQSNPHEFSWGTVAAQGGGTSIIPYGVLRSRYKTSGNWGDYTTNVFIPFAGGMEVRGTIQSIAGGNIYSEVDFRSGTSAKFYWNGRSQIKSPADGRVQFVDSGGSAGAALESASLTATNFLALSTNYVAENFTPIPGLAKFSMSNAVLYMVTETKTNMISDGR